MDYEENQQESRALDANLEFYGYPGEKLIEGVGRKLADRIGKLIRGKKSTTALFLIGPGNNGADGMATIRFLRESKRELTVHAVLYGEQKQQVKKQIEKARGKFREITRKQALAGTYNLVVEALFGTGRNRGIERGLEELLRNVKGKIKISIDLPVEPFRPDKIYSIHTLKARGAELVQLDYPKELEELAGPGDLIGLKGFEQGHKGDNGKILIIGGSTKYLGSLYFAGFAASHYCDLVYYHCPEQEKGMKNELPEAIPVDRKQAEEMIRKEEIYSVLVGPGLGKETGAAGKLIDLILKNRIRCVVDAEGIELIKGKKLNRNIVLTPHAGEFRKSFGIKANRKNAENIARQLGCTIVLKGAVDVIAGATETRINPFGNPGMTKGGTGDGLAGIITGLMARNKPFQSAVAGVFLLTYAADLLEQECGRNYSTRQLIGFTPIAKHMLESRKTRPYNDREIVEKALEKR